MHHFEPQMFFGLTMWIGQSGCLRSVGCRAGQVVAAFVTQTSVTQRKSWRTERFQAAAEFLIERYGAHIVFVGTASEAAAIDDLRKRIPRATSSFAGKTSLLQMAALLSLVRCGADTGYGHAACGADGGFADGE